MWWVFVFTRIFICVASQIDPPAANREHPTMKPVELVERALRNNSKTLDTILDCPWPAGWSHPRLEN